MLHPCRAAVSQNKSRFRQDGFDLDLSYVTTRIVVHGFPATGIEHLYRNPRTEVQRLLDKYHANQYKVYNFASEPGRTYPAQLFHGRVERFPFADHTCPPLESVVDFCESAKAWLDTDEANVVSLHCKAGKGRAGIMAACLMVRMGETAEAALATFDATRVWDAKGLTVVNQRKWVFMYERLIKEIWGLQDSIGMVPGQDPDLRAPSPATICIREISVQMEPTTDGKQNINLLTNLSCSLYQQKATGKVLVYSAKLVNGAPRDGEPGMVLAAALPRTAVLQGTFQVIFSAAAGATAIQKDLVDLWWNTTFVSREGGNQDFEVKDVDIFSSKLANRLQRAGARIVLFHTHPHAESPARRMPANSSSCSGPPDVDDSNSGQQVHSNEQQSGEEGQEQVLQDDADRPFPSRTVPASDRTSDPNGGMNDNQNEIQPKGAIGDVNTANISNTIPLRGSEEETVAAGESDEFTLKHPPRRHPSGAEGQDASNLPRSPSLPGPSPAGWASPTWMFDGRLPSSSGPGPSSGTAVSNDANAALDWWKGKMWSSGQTDEDEAPAEAEGVGGNTRSKNDRAAGSGVREKRHALMTEVNSGATTSAPTATGGSTRDRLGRQPYETESESDDQVAVRASGFASSAPAGYGGEVDGRPQKAKFFGEGGTGTVTASFSARSVQWVAEMEMAFEMERRRWEEHRSCLEAELDFALAARARAEARSEEDRARVDVLERRLTAWRSEHAMIEGDVKKAVRLLEMSLSGLVSAESALKRWKDHIPDKAYEDIMACLTRGDTTLARS